MVLTATYYSPAVPGDAGFSIDLAGDNRPRLGTIGGLITECELGAVGISSLRIDDPEGDVGNDGDAILGLKQLRVTESTAPSGKRRIWTGYIGDRTYSRGGGDSPSLITAASRVIDMTLVDINSFLSFRVFVADDANRPAETDVERIAWLLGFEYLSTTIFDNGLVSTLSPVNMDATDYKGQTSNDVLNDCAQQSGKNFFVYYDDSGSGQFSLFYDFNDSEVYLTDAQVTNVLADVDLDADQVAIGPIWPPLSDATLTRDPSRVIAGAYIPNGSNSVYRTRPSTAIQFGWRDAVAPAPSLSTVSAMNARADRYLGENATEDDLLKFSVRFPAANVNDWREGQAGQVRFSHLPGYEDWRWVRALRRETQQPDATDQYYVCNYECTPMLPAPSGAFSRQEPGIGFSGIPILPRPTTPGNLLLAMVVVGGAAPTIASAVGGPQFFDNPPITGSPPLPPYPSNPDWTIIGTAAVDSLGQNILGPAAGHAMSVAIAYRFVQPGEITTHPVAVSGDDAAYTAAAWLWEFPTTSAPTGGATFTTQGAPPAPPHDYALPSQGGNAIGIIAWLFADSGTEEADITEVEGSTVRSAQATNDPDASVTTGWDPPWVWIGLLPGGGSITANMATIPGYHELGAAGVVVELPSEATVRGVPDIPFPGNQSA